MEKWRNYKMNVRYQSLTNVLKYMQCDDNNNYALDYSKTNPAI